MNSRLMFSLCALCALCGESFSASPSLGTVQPRGWQRGTEKPLVFSGANLQDAQEVVVYYPGVTFKDVKAVNPTTVTATAVIAPDCRLGEHAFRIRTATGVSDLRTFWVGALPVLDELEPNSEFDKPQTMPLNTTVHGTIGGEDVDYFAVECKKGQRLSVEVEAVRLGSVFWDPHVAILDSRRFEMVASDDTPVRGQDGACSVVIPADGKYVVRIRESAYGGGAQYRLHIGNFPVPTAVVPAGGKPGEELEVRFLGDPAGEIKQKVKLPAAADPNFRLHCQTADGITPTGFRFRVADLPNTVESGANNAAAGATAGPVPGAFNGVVAKPGEVDFFKFAAKKGQTFEFQCHARRLGSPLDPVLAVGNDKGAQLAINDDSGGPDSVLRFAAPADGEFTVWVRDHLNKGGPDYFYRIEVAPVELSIATSLPRADPNNPANQDRQTVTVPKGNRTAVLVNANRVNVGGALAVGFEKLPAGVSIVAETMEAGQAAVPVVFEAKPDAPAAGVQTAITTKLIDPAAPAVVVSRTVYDTALSIGNPGQTVYSRHVTDRTVVAVGDAAPFAIEVIEPKVPVVQNGSYSLRVKATRAADFKGAITVQPLWVPPGLGMAANAVIPPESTETVIAVNAAPNAAARKWKTAVTAVSNGGGGNVWVSSQLFTLEVAPPFVTVAMDRPAVEQGAETQLFCKVTVNTPFDGKAKVTLLGLPAKVATKEAEITKGTTEFAFPIAAEKASAAGKHGGIFARLVIEKDGEAITHAVGGTELRIDVPLPPKVAATTPNPAATPAKTATPTPPPASTPMKRLTRLEQLRLDQEAREKAEAGGPAPKKDEPKKR